jgi:hypothetical protein
MKVFELIEKLKLMPQDAEVVGYSHTDEGDHYIEDVEACLPSIEFENGEISRIYPPYSCQADSYAKEIWLEEKDGYKKPIVYLVDYTNYEH